MIKIIHTADTHNNLTMEKAEILKNIDKNLLFDSGDIIKSGNIDFNIFGERAWKIYNYAGYDAICPGNREYHFFKCGFIAKNRGFNCPIITSNYIYKYKNKLTYEYKIFNINNTKIGVFALSNINISKDMKIAKIAAQYQDDIIDSAKNVLKNLDCDFTIALTHIGLDKDIILAESVDGIDLILGAHSHNKVVEKINNTTIVHSGVYANSYSEIIIDSANNICVKHIDL